MGFWQSKDLSPSESLIDKRVIVWSKILNSEAICTEIDGKFYVASCPIGSNGEYYVFDGTVPNKDHPSRMYSEVEYIMSRVSREDADTLKRLDDWDVIPSDILQGVRLLDEEDCRIYKTKRDINMSSLVNI